MWTNYSKSVEVPVTAVERITSVDALVHMWGQGGNGTTRVSSGHHDYSYVTADGTSLHMLNLDGLRAMEMDSKDASLLIVEPGVTFAMAATFLETRQRMIRNMPACNALTLAGAFCMASHGSGYEASVCDHIAAIDVLHANASTVAHISAPEDLKLWAGSMGVLGVITRLWVRTHTLQKVHDIYLFWKTAEELEAYWKRESVEEGNTTTLPLAFTKAGVFDQIFWTPVANASGGHFTLLKRRTPSVGEAAHLEQTHARSEETGWAKHVQDPLVPLGAKLVNTLRVWHLMWAAHAAHLTAAAYDGELKHHGIYNTLFRLNEPTSDTVVRLNKAYDIGEDCELFFPVKHTVEIMRILRVYNELFRLVMTADKITSDEWRSSTAKPLVDKFKMEARMVECTHDKAGLYTAPMEVRFLPATSSSAMAPNYNRTCLAISFSWFGSTREHHEANRRFCRFLLVFGWKAFQAVPHLGKFNMLESKSPEDVEVIAGWKQHYMEGRQALHAEVARTSERCVTPLLRSFLWSPPAAPEAWSSPPRKSEDVDPAPPRLPAAPPAAPRLPAAPPAPWSPPRRHEEEHVE